MLNEKSRKWLMRKRKEKKDRSEQAAVVFNFQVRFICVLGFPVSFESGRTGRCQPALARCPATNCSFDYPFLTTRPLPYAPLLFRCQISNRYFYKKFNKQFFKRKMVMRPQERMLLSHTHTHTSTIRVQSYKRTRDGWKTTESFFFFV